MSDNLLLLAERCEAATGPDRSLEIDIFATVMGLDPMVALGEKPFYTRSLDAAMTLVPNEAALRLYHWPKQTVGDRACVLIEGGQETWGATPALALCAAALRARASVSGEGVGE